jgi:hypothetical protein
MAHVWGRGGATAAPTGAPTTVPTCTPEPNYPAQDATYVAKPQVVTTPTPTPKPPATVKKEDPIQRAEDEGRNPFTPLGEYLLRKILP